VVDQSTNTINRVKRLFLITGILIVGLLDVAITTYVNDSDFQQPNAISIGNVSHSETSEPLNQRAEINGPEVNEAPSLASQLPVRSTEKSLTSYQGISLRSSNHSGSLVIVVRRGSPYRRSVALVPGCRTVSYPFISDNYYVRFTDDMGCLSAVTSVNLDRRSLRRRPPGQPLKLPLQTSGTN